VSVTSSALLYNGHCACGELLTIDELLNSS
jgi:hypothetical protein